MKNFIQSGNTITRAHTVEVLSGEPISLGALAGIASGKYAANESGEYDINGVCEFAKNTSLALVFGTVYDWDATAKEIVAGGTGDFELGMAVEDKQAADETGKILVNKMARAFN